MKSNILNKRKQFIDLPGEIWVSIFRDYLISNMGRVASLKGRAIKLLKTYPNNRGYHLFHPRINNKRIAYTIHRLVALIFLNNTDPLRTEVNHYFGKNDNSAGSLSWMSPRENYIHAVDNRLYTHGVMHYKTTLDPLQVKVIRSLRGQMRQRKIAAYFRISTASVGVIALRKSWKHVA